MKTNSFSKDSGSYASMGITSTQYMLSLDKCSLDLSISESFELIEPIEVEVRYNFSEISENQKEL